MLYALRGRPGSRHMVTIKSNIKVVAGLIQKKLDIIRDREYLLRPVAFDMIDLITNRIHGDGKASDNSPIGNYSSNYLKLRERKFKRNSDPKVIISLTRQLENDYNVIATQRGYAIGFLNKHNFDKSQFVQQTYGKRIFDLTESERAIALEEINDLVNKAIA